MKRFEVVVGEDFEIEAFELECVQDVAEIGSIVASHRRSRAQERIAFLLLGGIGFALFIAGCISIYDGSYNEISAVWAACALPLGAILKSYFEEHIPP